MIYNPDLEEIIADSMTLILDRSHTLDIKDQRAIGQEFREWLKEGCCLDELLTTQRFSN
tara:strand:- start:294 stop:470 length:177 start_codon:yes stop_codon:yes gene_type:complete